MSSQGVVNRFCSPGFDSPSAFASLLDHDRGGYFRLAPEHSDVSCKQLSYPDTGVLVTRFMPPDGVGEAVDGMPANTSRTPTDRHSLMRVIRAVRGTVRFVLERRPWFDYGRADHELEPHGQDVDALARAGRIRPARYTFEKMHTYANHVGLFAEEIGPSGEQLGNFPQAFTRLSLIMAASTLDEAIDKQRARD